jgi:hypothetical protein
MAEDPFYSTVEIMQDSTAGPYPDGVGLFSESRYPLLGLTY